MFQIDKILAMPAFQAGALPGEADTPAQYSNKHFVLNYLLGYQKEGQKLIDIFKAVKQHNYKLQVISFDSSRETRYPMTGFCAPQGHGYPHYHSGVGWQVYLKRG